MDDISRKRVYCSCCDDYVSGATLLRHKQEAERKERRLIYEDKQKVC